MDQIWAVRSGVREVGDLLQRARSAVEDLDWQSVLVRIEAILANPIFSHLATPQQVEVYQLGCDAAFHAGSWEHYDVWATQLERAYDLKKVLRDLHKVPASATGLLHRMAEHYRDVGRQKRAADAYAELKEHADAANCYAIAGDELRQARDYERALEAYLAAALEFRQARDSAGARDMNECARDCEQQLRDVDRNRALHDQAQATRDAAREQATAWLGAAKATAEASRAGFTMLAESLREGFMMNARALVEGMGAVAESQRQSAIAGAEILFNGLKQIAESQEAGFAGMRSAVREGDVLKAVSTWAALRGLSQSDSASLDAFRGAIAASASRMSEPERGVAGTHVVKLLDVMGRAFPPESHAPPTLIRQVVEQETRAHPSSVAALPRVSHGHCLLGARGPMGCVMTIVRPDGIFELCQIANAAHSRSWHGFQMFASKQLQQSACPLPKSRGILQRFLWLETCRLADGGEHRLSSS